MTVLVTRCWRDEMATMETRWISAGGRGWWPGGRGLTYGGLAVLEGGGVREGDRATAEVLTYL